MKNEARIRVCLAQEAAATDDRGKQAWASAAAVYSVMSMGLPDVELGLMLLHTLGLISVTIVTSGGMGLLQGGPPQPQVARRVIRVTEPDPEKWLEKIRPLTDSKRTRPCPD